MMKCLVLFAALALAGCAAGRNDGWSKSMNSAVVGQIRAVNGYASK